MVGMTGFEPAASCSRSKRATKLRYIPTCFIIILGTQGVCQMKNAGNSIPATVRPRVSPPTLRSQEDSRKGANTDMNYVYLAASSPSISGISR